MRTLLAGLALVLALACSGGGGGGSASGSGAPTLSNFRLNPDTVVQNQGGGAVTVYVSIDFTAPGGDGANLRITEGAQSETIPLSGMAGEVSGTIAGSLTLDTTQVGVYTFTVQLLTTRGVASNILSQTFTVIENPLQLLSISPTTVDAGGPAFTLTLTGTGFQSSSWAQWNGTWMTTTYVSPTTLQVQVPASSILTPGTVQISVYDSVYGTTAALPLTIGSGGNQVVALPTNDLAWDPARQVIYASIPSSAGSQGNAIAVIDPSSGTVLSSVFAGSEPGRLAISGDGSFLYAGINGAGAVQRFLLPSLAMDISIPLGSGPYDAGPNHALDLQVAPGAPHTVAVATGSSQSSPSFTGLTIFDDATPRAGSIPGWTGGGYLMDSIQWGADATTLFAVNNETTGFNLYRLAVSGAGATVASDVPAGIGTSWSMAIHYVASSNSLYSDSGGVVNAATLQQLGTFPAYGPMAPDPGLGFAYFLDQSTYYGSVYTLKRFDLAHFTPLSSHSVPVTTLPSSGYITPNPRRLVRWGSDGLAFGGGGSPLYLVSGAFVTGP